MKRFDAATELPREIPPGATYTRKEPARAPELQGDVAVPVSLIFVGASLAFLIVAVVCIVAKVNLWPAVIVGLLVAARIWFKMMQKWQDLWWRTEEWTGTDLNRDGYVGPPPTYYELPLSPNQRLLGELPITDTLLMDWCRTAINGGSLSYAAWQEQFNLNGSQGQARYAEFRAALVRQGLAKEVAGNVGLKLTRNGYVFAAAFAEVEPGERTPLLDAQRAIQPPHTADTQEHGRDST